MKAHPECIPCIIEQTLRAAKHVSSDPELHLKCLHDVCNHFSEIRQLDNPARECQFVYDGVMSHTGNYDPYSKEKKDANQMALKLLHSMSEDSDYFSQLEKAIQLSASGNIIDYGPQHSTNMEEDIKTSINKKLEICHADLLKKKIATAKNLLFLADNAGEIIFDSILLSLIQKMGLKITIALKSGPILNDITFQDAQKLQLLNQFRLIGTGSNAMGVDFDRSSNEFKHEFDQADIILAKGQANFESLEGLSREVFFLLRIKCPVIAKITGATVGESVLIFQESNGKILHRDK